MRVLSAYYEKLEKDKENGQCRKWRLFVRTDNGKRSRRFNGAYREMLRALDAFKTEIEEEGELDDGPTTFFDYAGKWLSYRERCGEYQVGTLKNDKRMVNALNRVFSDVRLCELTPALCREKLLELRNGGAARGRALSGTYMRKVQVTFHTILRQAMLDGEISSDPLASIPLPKRDTKEREAMTPDEMREFVERLAEEPLDGRVVCCYLIAYLGLRRGEACALRDCDVDFDASMVHIRRTVKEDTGEVGKTKTNAGTRDLPMPKALSDVLGRWLEVRSKAGYEPETFACSSTGTMLRPQNLYRWWESKRDGLGAPGMVLHQLRHSNLSMMARHMSVFDLQRWAGWSSIEPAKIYVHADMESLTRGSEDAFLHHFGTI